MNLTQTIPRTWFVTGTSSGFGLALTEAIVESGDRVVCAQRDPTSAPSVVAAQPDRTIVVPCDVTQPAHVTAAIDQAIERFGTIDVLVNNAGFGMGGAVEELAIDEIRTVFETNFFGAIAVMHAALPHMRAAGRGHIINFSSIGGFVGFAGSGAYCASKFALEGITEALALEVAPLGIHVTIVEPGGFRTDFSGRSIHGASRTIEAYEETSGKRRAQLKAGSGKQPGDPKKAAEAIVAVVRSTDPPLRLLLGNDAWERANAKLTSLSENFTRYETTTRSTDFESAKR